MYFLRLQKTNGSGLIKLSPEKLLAPTNLYCNVEYTICQSLISEEQWNKPKFHKASKLDSPSPMFLSEENLVLSNVLITGESNFDEKKCQRNVQLIRVAFRKEILLIK